MYNYNPFRELFHRSHNKIFFILPVPVLFLIFGSLQVRANETYSQLPEKRVTGKVVDETGKSLPGVNIRVEGTVIGTSSSATGEYSIDVPNENSILIFSFVGYIEQKVAVAGKTMWL